MARITVAYLRDLEAQVMQGEISYSRMVELLNEKAQEKNSEKDDKYLTDLVARKRRMK